VITRLVKLDAVGGHAVNEAMFLGDSAAPTAGLSESERFRLAYPSEWIGENGRHQVEHTERDSAVGLNPIS
jgi:hypothetical protein